MANTSQQLRIHAFSISTDGFSAGPRQSLEHPIGEGGMALHRWLLATRTFKSIHQRAADEQLDAAQAEGSNGHDEVMAREGFDNIGAWILGRNMFGPQRGAWPDDGWKGWWGDDPPYHVPVFVLTHHPRESIEMQGGTTFHFVTEGIHAALERARQAAQGKDVRLGGGMRTIHEYLHAGLVDSMHLAIAPAMLGHGEQFFSGLDLEALGYACVKQQPGEAAFHVVYRRVGHTVQGQS